MNLNTTLFNNNNNNNTQFYLFIYLWGENAIKGIGNSCWRRE